MMVLGKVHLSFLVLLALVASAPANSFAPRQQHQPHSATRLVDLARFNTAASSSTPNNNVPRSLGLKQTKGWLALATALTASVPMQALAVVDDVEPTELPPPYIPVVFAIAMIGGVGWLTSSLGNVMDEEASLGLQSGARAKKERERSSSSYFKKR